MKTGKRLEKPDVKDVVNYFQRILTSGGQKFIQNLDLTSDTSHKLVTSFPHDPAS